MKNSKNSDEMKKKEEKIRKLMEMQKKSIEEMIGRQHEKYGTFGSAMNVNGVDLSHLSVLSGAWHSLMQSEYISQRGKENTENVRKTHHRMHHRMKSRLINNTGRTAIQQLS